VTTQGRGHAGCLDGLAESGSTWVLSEGGTVPQIGFSTRTAVDERIEERTVPTDDGDHERFSHYVDKHKLTEAMVMGTPVVALCGKVWVPSRAPEKFPVCPECEEIWGSMKPGGDGNSGDSGDSTE
jgi:hypothetical protein